MLPGCTAACPGEKVRSPGSPRFSAVLRGSARFSAVLRGSPRFSAVLRGSPRFCAVLRGSPRFSVVAGCPRRSVFGPACASPGGIDTERLRSSRTTNDGHKKTKQKPRTEKKRSTTERIQTKSIYKSENSRNPRKQHIRRNRNSKTTQPTQTKCRLRSPGL